MRGALCRIACVALAAATCATAPAAMAQANPALRGPSTAPRLATQDRLPLQVSQVAASGASPFAAACGDASGALYIGAEVEPHVAVNPLNPNNLVGAWQQDRYGNGAARGVVAGASFDGGVTWALRSIPVSVCTGGEYARATDPWVSFSPDGTVHQVVLGVTGDTTSGTSGVLVSRSADGGLTWTEPVTLIRDTAGSFNDKETITADPRDSRFVYAAWDRLQFPGGNGPAMFARSTNGGAAWEAARPIFDPGGNDQTIGNLIRALPDGTLVNYMTVIRGGSPSLNVIRSTDRGVTWSGPIFVSLLGTVGTRDPATGATVRDGGILPQMAAGPDGALHLVWQDARFTQQHDAIAYSRSTDGGITWSAPVRVNFEPSVAAFTPQVHVRDDGVVAVTYYDLRSNGASPLTFLADFWMVRSSDGEHWTETRVAEAFDLNFAPNAGGLFLGDYTGLASAGATFIAFFGKTHATTANRTDIFAARIAPGTATSKRLAYRAVPMPAAEPPRAFRDAVEANTARALEARLARFRPGRNRAEEPPAMR